MERSPCRSCGAPLLWVRTAASGNLMPLDAEPVANGNVSIVDGLAHVHNGTLFEGMLPDGPRYQSHFASCPEAQKWKKKRGGA